MTPFLDDGDVTLYHGDSAAVLATLPDGSVDCVVTSPPYFGLRDYGYDGQIGLEDTPAAFVARLVDVFREVRRVLAPHGTCWVNMGDSYASGAGVVHPHPDNRGGLGNGRAATRGEQGHAASMGGFYRAGAGKPKDLLGIPWRLAFALQEPWYAGTIRRELDRVWLAAMIDAEGCMYLHRRREGQSNGQGYVRKADSFGAGLEVANTSLAIVERCKEITGRGSIVRQDKDRRQPLYRWTLRTNECRAVIREVYPYLVAKQHEARLVIGCPSSGPKATEAWEAVKTLHGGGTPSADFAPPESMHEPGWWVRSDVIWSKLNPMPESVTDRPTKAHEYLFLLTKAPRYYWDAEGVREGYAPDSVARNGRHRSVGRNPDRADGGGFAGIPEGSAGRNVRTVWTFPTEPNPEAHFATFPRELVRRCLAAGCPERVCAECGAPSTRIVEREATGHVSRLDRQIATGGAVNGGVGKNFPTHVTRETTGWTDCGHGAYRRGVVLDPFVGSGTTAVVARAMGMRCVGIDGSAEYLEIARKRTQQLSLLGGVA